MRKFLKAIVCLVLLAAIWSGMTYWSQQVLEAEAQSAGCPNPNPNLSAWTSLTGPLFVGRDSPSSVNCPLPAGTATTGLNGALTMLANAISTANTNIANITPVGFLYAGRVSTNTALQALNSTAVPRVYRGGFSTDGDGGGVWFTASGSPCSLNSGLGDNGSQTKSNDGKCWIADFSQGIPKIQVWGGKADNTTDIGAPMQAAFTANVCVRIPAGIYLITTPVALSGHAPCFQGDGFNEAVDSANGTARVGTWLHRSATGFTPFTITSVTGQGGSPGFKDIAFYEDQPNPTGSFTATQYPYWISASSILGRIDFENLNFNNSSACISLVASARTHMTKIMGQPTGTCLFFDGITDVVYLDQVDFWTFWAATGTPLTNVFNYNTANVDPIVFDRADSPFIGSVFVFGYHSGIKFASSGSGVTTGAQINSLQTDASKYGVWITGNNTTLQISNLRTSGGNLTGTQISGSEGYRDEASGTAVSIGTFQCFYAGSDCVQLTSTGELQLGNTDLWQFNKDNNSSTGLAAASGAAIRVSQPPNIVNPFNGGTLLPASVSGAFYSGPFAQPWTPVLAGSTAAGTPAYTTQAGDFRDDGTNIIANFTVQLNGAFTGATGNVLLQGFPRTPTGLTNHNGFCTIGSHSGVVLDASYTIMGGELPGGGTAQAVIVESGGGVSTQSEPVSTIGSNANISGTCTYRWN